MNALADRAHIMLAAVPAERREEYLHTSSELPGHRTNLALAQAAADLCDEQTFRRWIASEDEYLAMCAAIGLGRLIAAGRGHLWPLLRAAADDPRPRVREGAAMGLQRIADADLGALLDEIDPWIDGSPLLRRAAVAGVSLPHLLTEPSTAHRVTMLVERVTWTMCHEPRTQAPGVRALRRALGSSWSIMVAADPAHAMPAFTRMSAIDHPDARWLAEHNRPKHRSPKNVADQDR